MPVYDIKTYAKCKISCKYATLYTVYFIGERFTLVCDVDECCKHMK